MPLHSGAVPRTQSENETQPTLEEEHARVIGTATLLTATSVATTPTHFDRERIVLYVAAAIAIALVAGFYIAGYLVPARDFAKAIVNGTKADTGFPVGCHLLFMEHANRLQSAYALRFLGMLMGIAITFVGMMFTIKGLEAGYSLDVATKAGTASLKTASPGLALCTIGVALIVAAVLHTSELSFQNISLCFE